MAIFLGNLNIDEIENRIGIKFPQALIDFMKTRKQEKASNINPGKWHCFDIPFNLVCGDIETVKEIYKHLAPIAKDFKTQLQISLDKSKFEQHKLWLEKRRGESLTISRTDLRGEK